MELNDLYLLMQQIQTQFTGFRVQLTGIETRLQSLEHPPPGGSKNPFDPNYKDDSAFSQYSSQRPLLSQHSNPYRNPNDEQDPSDNASTIEASEVSGPPHNQAFNGINYSQDKNHHHYRVQRRGKAPTPQTFSGEYEQFTRWWVRFDDEINTDERLSTKQKYILLQQCISHLKEFKHYGDLPASEDHYIECLDRIHDRFWELYAEPEKMITRISKYKQMNQSLNADTLLSIQLELLTVNTHVRTGKFSAGQATRIVKAVYRKLPDLTRSLLAQNEDCLTLPYMLDVVKGLIKSTETVEDQDETHSTSTTNHHEKKRNSKKQASLLTSVPRTSTQSSSSNRVEIRCMFCQESHKYFHCQLNAAQRKIEAVKQSRCLLCLKERHESACPHPNTCRSCKSSINFALCPCREVVENPLNTTSTTLALNKSVCFQTISFTVNDCKVRAIFDNGSGVNLISEDCTKRLKLKQIPALEINIAGVTHHIMKSNRYVNLHLTDIFGSQTSVKLHVVKTRGWGKFPGPPAIIQNYLDHNGLGIDDDPELNVEIVFGVTLSNQQHLHLSSLPHDFWYTSTRLGCYVSGGKSDLTPTSSLVCTVAEALDYNSTETEKQAQAQFLSQFLEHSIRDDGERWEVRLPIIDVSKLLTNRSTCEAQTRRNVKTYHKRGMYEDVNQIVQDWISLDVVEEVPVAEMITNNPIHYLAHHAVRKESSLTTKLRFVINGSLSGTNKVSLNDTIMKGFSTWNLVSSIHRFRKNPFVLVGDISKAFLMVSVYPAHRDLLRFFWIDEQHRLKVYRFRRVPFGTSASPFLLFAALEKTFDVDIGDPSLRALLKESFYVDDFINSFANEDEREIARSNCQASLSKRGMKINWETAELTSVLGHTYTTSQDTLTLQFPTSLQKPVTIRDLLSIIARIYDPCGFLTPYLAELRRILSSSWKETPEFDARLSEDSSSRAWTIMGRAEKASLIPISRYTNYHGEDYELHTYTDASVDTISIAVYGGLPDQTHTLLFAKTKLLHRRTIPDAELDAIMLCLPTLPSIIHIYNPSELYLHTDSQINVDRLTQSSINKLTFHHGLKVLKFTEQFRTMKISHISSEENCADWATKLPDRFDIQDWYTRPPRSAKSVPVMTVAVATELSVEEPNPDILDSIEEASTLTEVTGQFELQLILQAVQLSEWPTEYRSLSKGRQFTNKSLLGSYAYSFEDRIIKVHLRHDFDHPKIILPRNSRFTELLLKQLHEECHSGSDSVKAKFSDLYYVEGLKRVINSIIAQCTFCQENYKRKLKFHPGPLPVFRTTPPDRAFKVVTMDFAQFHVGGKRLDVLLIACAHSRAIFLEPVEDQSTLSVLTALTRLFSIYGLPDVIYSDNQSSYTRAGKIIRKLSKCLQEASTSFTNIKWIFAVAHRPQTNGLTERLIGLTKRMLRGVGLNEKTTRPMFIYYLTEVNRLMNSRPLFRFDHRLITPMDLILGHTPAPLPHPIPSPLVTEFDEIKTLHLLRKRISGFWTDWKKGYFLSLREVRAHRATSTLSVGDTVLLQDKIGQPRDDWRTGKIIAVYPGVDSTIRVCDVELDQLKADQTHEILYRRSVDRIVKLSHE